MKSSKGFDRFLAVNRRLYPERAFGGFTSRDGGARFYLRVRALLESSPHRIVVDLGCGLAEHRKLAPPTIADLYLLRGRATRVIGLDVDPAAKANETIDEFRLIDGDRLPIDSNSIDVCVSDWVLEHVRDVSNFYAECARIIRPGGFVCIRTPNRFHYSSIGASLIPARLHERIRTLLGHPHEGGDVFPTYYRSNTTKACRRWLSRSGFAPMVYAHRGESHLSGLGYVPGLLGKWIEELAPPFLSHEIHAFGRRLQS
jgi:SAM-dependent methyltransferase